MSSSMPIRRCAALVAVLGLLLVPGVAWAQPSGVVVPEGALDGRSRLVVGGDGPIAVTVAGQPQPITTTPLVSERTAMALVVDASAEGGAGGGWRRGGGRGGAGPGRGVGGAGPLSRGGRPPPRAPGWGPTPRRPPSSSRCRPDPPACSPGWGASRRGASGRPARRS